MDSNQFFGLFNSLINRQCDTCKYMRKLNGMKACEKRKKILVDIKGCQEWKQK